VKKGVVSSTWYRGGGGKKKEKNAKVWLELTRERNTLTEKKNSKRRKGE